MSLLSIVNRTGLIGSPYRALAVHSSVEYHEAEPSLALDWLLENRVDAALLPLSVCEDAGVSILPFGVILEYPLRSLFLLSDVPANHCNALYYTANSDLDSSLLRELFARYPQLPSRQTPIYRGPVEYTQLPQSAAVLTDVPPDEWQSRFCVDIQPLFQANPELQFAACAWALKPDSDFLVVASRLSELLDEALRFREIHLREWSESEQHERALVEQYAAAALSYATRPALRSVPAAIHRHSSRVYNGQVRTVDEILARASEGQRITFREACVLASEASLGDLGMAAQLARKEIHPSDNVPFRLTRRMSCISYSGSSMAMRSRPNKTRYLNTADDLHLAAQETMAAGITSVLLGSDFGADLDVSYYCELCSMLKGRYGLAVYGISTALIASFAGKDFSHLQPVLERIRDCGIRTLIDDDSTSSLPSAHALKPEQWERLHTTAQALGMRSHCSLILRAADCWPDRLRVLHRVRRLQEETGGVTSFSIVPFVAEKNSIAADPASGPQQDVLKGIAISRLMLHSVPFVRCPWENSGPSLAQATLCFGANYLGSVIVTSATISTMKLQVERHIAAAGYQPIAEC